jgi:hypothetical protein
MALFDPQLYLRRLHDPMAHFGRGSALEEGLAKDTGMRFYDSHASKCRKIVLLGDLHNVEPVQKSIFDFVKNNHVDGMQYLCESATGEYDFTRSAREPDDEKGLKPIVMTDGKGVVVNKVYVPSCNYIVALRDFWQSKNCKVRAVQDMGLCFEDMRWEYVARKRLAVGDLAGAADAGEKMAEALIERDKYFADNVERIGSDGMLIVGTIHVMGGALQEFLRQKGIGYVSFVHDREYRPFV